MQVRECMSAKPDILANNASIREAAMRMKENGEGMIPVYEESRLIGVVTDRDLVVRALADNISLDESLSSVISDSVLYCCEGDDIQEVLRNMRDNQVQRLIVLNNAEEKELVGVVSVSDIADHCQDESSVQAIADCCRHYH